MCDLEGEMRRAPSEGRSRGYFDLACGELVHTPQSKLQQHVRVQLPLRKGMLFRILLGQRKAGSKKASTTQHNLIYLRGARVSLRMSLRALAHRS